MPSYLKSQGHHGNNGGNNEDPPAQCPPSCCTGDELLCISIPCPINIVLLGALNLNLSIPCISLASVGDLTPGQAQQLLGLLQAILAALVGGLGSAAAAPAQAE